MFHINISEGSSYGVDVEQSWEKYIGSHSITVDDLDKIPEVIVSIIQALRGDSVDKIADSWDGSTAVVVKEALKNLAITPVSGDSGVVMF